MCVLANLHSYKLFMKFVRIYQHKHTAKQLVYTPEQKTSLCSYYFPGLTHTKKFKNCSAKDIDPCKNRPISWGYLVQTTRHHFCFVFTSAVCVCEQGQGENDLSLNDISQQN